MHKRKILINRMIWFRPLFLAFPWSHGLQVTSARVSYHQGIGFLQTTTKFEMSQITPRVSS